MPTVTRRQGREWALQLLFQLDANPVMDPAPAIRAFWAQQFHLQQDHEKDASGAVSQQPVPGAEVETLDPEAAAARLAPAGIRSFTEKLVRGVTENLDAIDDRLVRYTAHWPLHRMGGVDRNVLRLAIFEMFFNEDAPPVVIINEAVDLAKYFSSSESGRFVNGILDRACKDVTRPPREPGRRQAGGHRRRDRRPKPGAGGGTA